MQHLHLVGGQRNHYQEAILKKNYLLGEKVATSFDMVILHSCHFAQQFFIPNSSQHVGSLYFLVPYKTAQFGYV